MPDWAAFNPFYALIQSMVDSLKDALFTTKSSWEVLETLELTESTKKGLYLNLRNSNLHSLTGSNGHMIERSLILKEIPAFEEIPAQEFNKAIDGFRKAHYDQIHTILPEKLNGPIEKFVEHLSQGDLIAAKKVLIDTIDKLNLEIIQLLKDTLPIN